MGRSCRCRKIAGRIGAGLAGDLGESFSEEKKDLRFKAPTTERGQSVSEHELLTFKFWRILRSEVSMFRVIVNIMLVKVNPA
jgi:hypothetical protein